jgi:aryl-alcohol dehydrogenase-like predicted oxidoreductase
MQYRQLGKTELEVSVFGLGGNTFGQHATFNHYNDEQGSIAIIRQAADRGINLIDTADIYSNGLSESYIGKAIAGHRDDFVILSKVGMAVDDDPQKSGLSAKHIMASIEGSLRRLGTDYLDLYCAHQPDPMTPVEETLKTLDDLVRQGKVRFIGCSNFSGRQIADANDAAEQRGCGSFMVSQSPYNLLDRSIETDILPCCLQHEMSVVVYAPLAQGILTGKYKRGAAIPAATRAWENPDEDLAVDMTDAKLALVERLDEWARRHGHRVGELAIAWLLAQPGVASALTGVTSIDQLEANIRATEWVLEENQVIELNAMSRTG